jgi:H+-transporting ATPase
VLSHDRFVFHMIQAANKETGLKEGDILPLRTQYGFNELPEKKVNPFLLFLSYLWGPMPIMIWLAIIIELAKAIAVGAGWEDFGVLMFLQFLNATVGFIEEKNSGDAIAALKQQLAPQSHVCRDGIWKNIPARELVPGDLIELKIGDIIPADAILLDGHAVEVDQAALTGESLPVTIDPWGHVKMGSALKRGEIKAVVTATGLNTFFGKAAGMIASVVSQGHLATVLLSITVVLLVLSFVLCSIILIVLMSTPQPQSFISNSPLFVNSISVVIVILVASIPIAIEVVCTSTLAVGSHKMAEHKVIVARLSAIEELAGMTILCSDKTGTLTLNKLSLRDPILYKAGITSEDMIFYSALASKRLQGNQDAIDFCITSAVDETRKKTMDSFKELFFMPFNPTDKRTEARIEGPDGKIFLVSKGAPQVILRMCANKAEIESKVKQSVQELADRGFRALGVGMKSVADDPACPWEYLGVLSLYDPPRHDTKSTIAAAIDNGIEVKMVTGDHGLIAKETCRELGMGTNILNTEVLNDPAIPKEVLDRIILEAHGFAEVLPEHKFQIVDRIRLSGHVTGMTGDGVNDAPALKRADIGIAVHGATDAARAAADIVLTTPGLSVIIEAIFQSRMIFQRMRNYIIYRIACTIQLLCFFFFASIAISPDTPQTYNKIYTPNNYAYYVNGQLTVSNFAVYPNWCVNVDDCDHTPQFTLPVISLVIITILNDGCMITISQDKVIPEKRPQKWFMREMWVIALVLGGVALLSSLLMLAYCLQANYLNPGNFWGIIWGSSGRNYLRFDEIRSIIYLKISISDFLTLFSARTRSWFWERGLGWPLAVAACIALAASTLLALFWGDFVASEGDVTMAALRYSNGAVIGTWVYCLLWWMAQDICKVFAYYILDTYFKSEEEKKIENYAKRHSLEYTDPNAPARKRSHEYLPSGTDLNAILNNAKDETARMKKKQEEEHTKVVVSPMAASSSSESVSLKSNNQLV